MNHPQAALGCQQLDVSIGELRLVHELDMRIAPGELVCIIGCNGAGKSTLLHTLAGLRASIAGSIQLQAQPLSQLARRDIARRLALLLQHHDDSFPMTVIDAVASARHPHRGFLAWESQNDRELAMSTLQRLGLEQLSDRDVASLSGGERQRVALAAVLTQQPSVYLLDEPLNNLDPRHQLAVMHLLRAQLASGAAVLTVMHDLHLVARFADRVLLLYGPAHDGAWLLDETAACMTAGNLSQLYGTPIERHTIDDQSFFSAA